MVLKLPPFYTARYVEVHSPTLSLVWLLCGLAIVLLTVVHGWFASYSFVERGSPDIDVKMWQDYAVDGSWWPTNATLQREEAGYREDERCGNLKYVSVSETHGTGTNRWGSNTGIKCIAPGETRTPLFYAGPNEINVATSIAYGDNPQYDTDRVFTYRGIELSTIVFAPSFSTDFNVHSVHNVPHVRDCVAMAHDGITPLHNRYRDLHPGETYGAGFLQLSLEDVLAAAGTSLRATGGEGAQPIRLSGLELAAYVDVRNYNDPFSWPFDDFNPLNLDKKASDITCEVKFEMLRNEFTPVQWFYNGTDPMALQHGVRIKIIGTGSIGHFSFTHLFQSIVIGFGAFGLAQVILDYYWFYFFKKRHAITPIAFHTLNLEDDAPNASNQQQEKEKHQ